MAKYDTKLMLDSLKELVKAKEGLEAVLKKIDAIDTTENDKQAGDHIKALAERVQSNRDHVKHELEVVEAAIRALKTMWTEMNQV